jgi:outer membrane protein assembly factor BamA
MRALFLLLCLLPAPLSAAPSRRGLPPAGGVIASIKIETHNVFDTDVPPDDKFIYKAANNIHIKTFAPVIERELLFEVGDPYDPLLIEETERNLRGLSFIRRAEISATVNKQGTVDVIVRTFDSWTLEVVASFKRGGGQTSVKAGLAEHNILGEGKSGSAVYSRDGGAESKSFGYKDVQFLHYKRMQYSMLALTAPGSQTFEVSLIRPFYASIAKKAAGATVSYASSKAADGTSRRTGEAGVNYGVALATSTERTRRVNFGLLTHRAESTGGFPNLEQLTFLKFGVEREELDFLTVRRIQNFTHDEDFNLGFGIIPTVAWAPKISALGTTQDQIIPGVAVHKGFTWSDQLLLLKSGVTSKYVNGANGNRIASFDAAYFVRGLKYQTLAFHTGLDLGWRLDAANQLVLGEVNGLRGYGLSEFSGDRRFLFNIEDRVYVWDDLFSVMDVGSVLFYDSGDVWQANRSMKLGDLKNSVGFGLRVAPSRSGSNSPVRIDVAFPLRRSAGAPLWSLSILAGQAF